MPTPGRYENLLVDRFLAAEYRMDLVENTANAIWSKEFDKGQLQLSVSERLLQARVASLQTLDGPWHPVIHDLRTDSLLKSYRRRIQNVSGLDDISDLDARVGELSDEFERVTKQIVQDHFDTMSLGKSAAMFLVGLIPVVGNIIGGAGLLKEIADKIEARKNRGWVAFLGKAERK